MVRSFQDGTARPVRARDRHEPAARAGAAARRPRPGRPGARLRRRLTGPRAAPWWLLAPFLIGFLATWLFPVAWSFLLSFEHWSAVRTTWAGLANYRFVLADPTVRTSFANLAWYAVVNDVFQVAVAVILALLLDLHFVRRFSGALTTAFFVPNVVPGAAIAILFGVLLGTGGLADKAMGLVGLHVDWLGSAEWSKPAVIIAGSWQWIGFWVMVLVAALRHVPADLYNAVRVDGGGIGRRIWHISLPQIRPALVFVIVMNTIGTMQLFDIPFLIYGAGNSGGPDSSATTPLIELYQFAFSNVDLGSAAALGWLLTALIMIVTVVFMTIAMRRNWLSGEGSGSKG